MRYIIHLLFLFICSTSSGQNKLDIKFTINSSNNFGKAFLFFPIPIDTTDSYRLDLPKALKCDSLNIESGKVYFMDTTIQKRKLFYCIYKDQKSRIYNLDADVKPGQQINFIIPAPAFYDSLYTSKTCPLCHKSNTVVPLVYGKVGDSTIKLAKKGELKLAGCSRTNTSPKLYCKADCIEF